MGEPPGARPRNVIVFEDRAHIEEGHFPNACGDLARALAAMGCTVELLTMAGWAGDGDPQPAPFRVTTAPKWIAWLFLRSELLVRRASTLRPPLRAGVRLLADALRAFAGALAIRHARRRSPAGTGVVSVAFRVNPIIAAAVDGPGRILHHTFFGPPFDGPPQTASGRLLDRLARRAEARRRARGGGMRLAVGSQEVLDAWRRRAPYLDPVLLRHAASRAEVLPTGDRRARFGIADDARVALVFGSQHGSKDLDTIWRAFAALSDWTLLVVGNVAEPYESWFAANGGRRAVVCGGFVDARTRADAYAAADVVVVSFEPGHQRDSGVVQDAITFGVPVLCSDACSVGAEVEAYRVGATFAVGDSDALVEALRQGPRPIAADDLAAARAASSAAASAEAHLAAFAAIP